MALVGMFQQFGDAIRYWKVKTKDFIIWFGAFWFPIIFDISIGMALSIALSVLILLYSSSNPYSTLLVPVSGTELYRDHKRVSHPVHIPHIAIFRFHGSVNFSNTEFFQLRLYQTTFKDPKCPSGSLHTVILDASTLNEVDSTGVKQLAAMAKEMRGKYHVRFMIANVRGQLRDIMDQLRFEKVLGMKVIFTAIHDAVLFAVRHGKNADYLAASSVFEAEQTSRISVDTDMAVGHEMEQLQDALEQALASGDIQQQAGVELQLGEDHLDHFNVMIAREHFATALQLASQLDNSAWVRRARAGLGQSLLATGDFEESADHHEIELQLALLDASYEIALCLARLHVGGALRHVAERRDEARNHLNEAVMIAQRIGDKVLRAKATFELSMLLSTCGEQDDAAHAFGEAVTSVRELWAGLSMLTKTQLSTYLRQPPPASAEQQQRELEDANELLTDFGVHESLV